MNFGQALEKLKQNLAVARHGWNGSGQFVYLVPANAYPAQTGVAQLAFPQGPVPYEAYFALVNAKGTVSTWVPSVSDCLEEDWYEIDLAFMQQENDRKRREGNLG